MTSLWPDGLCKDSLYKSEHVLRFWELGLQHIFLEDTVQP